jgi:predicted nucleic acid-binding protein
VLVLDTSVVVASLDAEERMHVPSRDLIEATDERIVMPSPILCEVDHLIHRKFGAAFLRRVRSGEFDVEEMEPGDLGRTIELMERCADLDVGYVEAAVLAIVERLGGPKLATLDHRHFSVMQPRHVEALELVPR